MAKQAVMSGAGESGLVARMKSWPLRVRSFYHDVRTEMKKVSTPTRKEVQSTTMVVVITVAIFGLYFFIIDNAVGRGVDALFHYFRAR